MVGRAQALGWRNIPAPSPQACEDWARPACLSADSGLPEPSLLSPPLPQPASPPVRLQYLSLLAKAEETVSPGKKTWEIIKIHLPRQLRRADRETLLRGSA